MTLLGRAHPQQNSTGQCRVDTSQARPYTIRTLGQQGKTMTTRRVDWETLRNWEERLDVAYQILDSQRRSGIWTVVCDEALRDLDSVRREIDWEVFDTAMETWDD